MKVVLVTGAARGIGRRIATRFAETGARVVATDIDEAGARDCADSLGADCVALPMDVRDPQQVARTMQRIFEDHGGIDVLVNNAGAMTQGPFAKTTGADFGAMLDVNVLGIFHCVQAVAPFMIDQRRGLILNLASVSAARGGGAVGNVWYGASKAAVVAMTTGLARELGVHGVRVNAIAPGVVETEMVRDFLTPQVRERVMPRFPLGRLATVDDVADAALFLASDAASFITGQTLAVDGGFLAT